MIWGPVRSLLFLLGFRRFSQVKQEQIKAGFGEGALGMAAWSPCRDASCSCPCLLGRGLQHLHLYGLATCTAAPHKHPVQPEGEAPSHRHQGSCGLWASHGEGVFYQQGEAGFHRRKRCMSRQLRSEMQHVRMTGSLHAISSQRC